jgi:hypothetical protein
MRQSLNLHSESRCSAVRQIEVDIERPRPGHLNLRYVVTGKIGGLRLPPPTAPKRTDELWKHTCFEAFVQEPPTPPYYEFNLSTSTQWAAYAFTSYRSGMSLAPVKDAPKINVQSSATRFELLAVLNLGGLPNLPANSPWRLAISAVIEETNGDKSYWALSHPKGRADFHHSDCFALELAGA